MTCVYFRHKCNLFKNQNNSVLSVLCLLTFNCQLVCNDFLHSFVVIFLMQ